MSLHMLGVVSWGLGWGLGVYRRVIGFLCGMKWVRTRSAGGGRVSSLFIVWFNILLVFTYTAHSELVWNTCFHHPTLKMFFFFFAFI